MGKMVCCTAFLLVAIFVHESICMPHSISKPSLDLLKARLQRKSVLSHKLNAHVNGASPRTSFKRQGNPQQPQPPSPPERKSVWYFLEITREDFINDHEDDLTSEVRGDIAAEMEDIISNVKHGMEYVARLLSCMVLSMPQDVRRSVDSGTSLNDVETDIETEEEAEEKELDDLLKYLGLEDEQTIVDMLEEYTLPRYVKDCQESPIIMRTGNETIDDVLELVVCSRLIALRTENKIARNDEDSLPGFVDQFEDFLDGAFSIIRLYLDYFPHDETEEDGEVQRNLNEKQLGELGEIKRALKKYLGKSLFRK